MDEGNFGIGVEVFYFKSLGTSRSSVLDVTFRLRLNERNLEWGRASSMLNVNLGKNI